MGLQECFTCRCLVSILPCTVKGIYFWLGLPIFWLGHKFRVHVYSVLRQMDRLIHIILMLSMVRWATTVTLQVSIGQCTIPHTYKGSIVHLTHGAPRFHISGVHHPSLDRALSLDPSLVSFVNRLCGTSFTCRVYSSPSRSHYVHISLWCPF